MAVRASDEYLCVQDSTIIRPIEPNIGRIRPGKARQFACLTEDQSMTEENPQEEAATPEPGPLEIRLDQFLQLCGVPTGGQAKILIQGGEVTVNGEVETRRRKKLHVGDVVGLDGEEFDVAFEPADEED